MGKDHSKNVAHAADQKAKKDQVEKDKKATKAKVGRKGNK